MIKKSGTTNLSNRIEWIDLLRFFGILSIYYGHYAFAIGKPYAFVFCFHVPLFFFVSGIFVKRNDSFFEIIKKKSKRLLVPYWVFSFVYCVLLLILNDQTALVFGNNLMGFLLGIKSVMVSGPFWFLIALWTMFIVDCLLYKLLKKVLKKEWLVNIILLLIAVVAYYMQARHGNIIGKLKYFSFDNFFNYYFYFIVGSIFSDKIKQFSISNKLEKKSIALLMLFILVTVITFVTYFCGSQVFISLFPFYVFWRCIVEVVVAFSIIIFFAFISYMMPKIPWMIDVGNNTLYLCCLEDFTKVLLACFLAIFNINISYLTNPLSLLIITIIVLYINNNYFIPLIKKYFKIFS